MSLDLMRCRIVSPAEANYTYKITEHPALRRFQETGILCVYEERFGRNCLCKAWHDLFDEIVGKANEIGYEEQMDALTIIFPGEEQKKLLKWVSRRKNKFNGNPWIDEAQLQQPWDFIYVSW